MITTFLLDLDDTLLGNDMDNFLPPYFAYLKKRLGPLLDMQDLQQTLFASVQAMQANQDPTVTNMAAFMADFTQRLGHKIEAIQPALEAFYSQDYPQLQQYTTPQPEARPLVRYLLAGGYKVVIATNPMFPATAIEQRLDWAGIGDFPYALITTMENSHFTKPNPRYYQEILTKIESGPEATWMVGDNLVADVGGAQAAGIHGVWHDYQRRGLPEDAPIRPDRIVHSLGELL